MISDKVISSYEFLEQMENEDSVAKFNSGLIGLDLICEGFEPGELYVLSGATKNGKTTLFQTLTAGFEKHNVFSLWFSYEVPPKSLIRRFKNLPLFYLPEKIKDRILPYLSSKIKEARDKYGIRVVFIDHLHYLLDLGRVKNPSLEIGTVIRGLKRMAIDHEVIIFLATHTTKLKDDKIPTAEDIRDSSFVGQESDCVMILWRVRNHENVSRLKVEFHRRIGILNKTIDLVFHDGELRETNVKHSL